MDSAPTLPQSHSELTGPWLQTVFDHAGLDASIDQVRLSPIGTGQMASSFRAELTYHDPGDAPGSVVIKMTSDDEASRAAGAQGAYLKEVRFYQQLAGGVDLSIPTMYFADVDDASEQFVLVLEDLRPAEQGDQIAGCTVEQARLAATNIAGLHGPSWCVAGLYDHDWLTVPPHEAQSAIAQAEQMVALMTEAFIDRYRARLEPGDDELVCWFASNVGEWLTLGSERFSLLHGDHRLDNLLFGTAAGGRPVTAVDWQTLAVRNPLADIAYLLGTGLDIDTRRAVEADIVDEYHHRLVSYGIDDYTVAQCFDDYRAQAFHSTLIIVLGSMLAGQTERGDEMFMAMLRRSVAQIDDLDARSCLS